MPRPEKRLPEEPLIITQVETVLGLPDLDDPLGVRDRAIMEPFYPCGLRRSELVRLNVTDKQVKELMRSRS
jgi:integrase/recombinase XerD